MQSVIYQPKKFEGDSLPFSAYPRPQMKRNSYFCLNGEWDFAVTRQFEESGEYDKKILVPFPPESPLSGICMTPEKGEILHYRRFFSLPENFCKNRVILHFGAADQHATVYLNGFLVGEHTGGYHPFFFDVTEFLQTQNELVVRVRDDLDLDLPYGKQTKKRGGMWYTPTSGLWQTVWLESVPESYIRSISIRQSIDAVTIKLDTDAREKRLTLKESGESFVFTENTFTFAPAEAHLWSPESPYLYHFTLRADEDEIESYFALREIRTESIDGIPRILLNGKPYFIQALLDQGYYPDGHFLPASVEGYVSDILNAKAMGYNTLRKHIKIEPMLFYHACDQYGMIVFQDIVNNGKYSFLRDTALPTIGFLKRDDKKMHRSEKSRSNFKAALKETILHLESVPSVLLYTLFNEGWGQFCADEIYRYAKNLDPSRIYDATSGWFWQKDSDLDSLHVYFKPLNPQISLSRPLIISEFGGYSLRIENHLATKKNYGYKSFESEESLFSALEKLYIEQALPLVKKGLCGLVYTQIADVEDETNGLFTFDRARLKVDAAKMKRLLSCFEEKIKE